MMSGRLVTCCIILLWQIIAVEAAATGEGTSTASCTATAATAAGLLAAALTTNSKGTRPRRAKQKAIRGSGNQAVAPDGKLFYSNITAWGPQAKRYFKAQITGKEECPWDCIGVAEHHLRGDKLNGLRKTFKQCGYTARAADGQ